MKLDVVGLAVAGHQVAFPPTIVGGLIEAGTDRVSPVGARTITFPPTIVGGLIEAAAASGQPLAKPEVSADDRRRPH